MSELLLEISLGKIVANSSMVELALTLCRPHLYNTNEAPHYTRGLSANLAMFVAIIVIVGIGAAWIRVLNGRHAAERVRLGKSAQVVDLSMESKRRLSAQDEAVNDSQIAGGVGDKAFEDCTDLKNEDFIYVY